MADDIKVTEEMLKKECPNAEVAFDKVMCANFLKQNQAKREKVKGQSILCVFYILLTTNGQNKSLVTTVKYLITGHFKWRIALISGQSHIIVYKPYKYSLKGGGQF